MTELGKQLAEIYTIEEVEEGVADGAHAERSSRRAEAAANSHENDGTHAEKKAMMHRLGSLG